MLSGTGSDGSLGVRAIKGEGGMVMVQSTGSADYDGMPRSAIATGLVDYELPPAEMPARIISYVAQAFGKLPNAASVPAPKVENVLKKIFILLRSQTGHDFSHYKPSTIQRRIERRMALQQIETLDSYVRYLQQTPTEVKALFRDLLIGVTSFFRDPDTFRELEEKVIPKIFAGKPAGGVIRVWSPGCATGEEAYSIAILLQERLEDLKQSYKVQVFATDIDNQAIATARSGFYPASIASDISPERLSRFFSSESDGSAYRINKGIRDLLIFSEQDVIKDPPFSKLDLISCRNLMIYMDGDLQKKLIPLFHYALNPGSFLFLGTSETVGEFADLFSTLERKSKIYQRKENFHGIQRATSGRFIPHMPSQYDSGPRISGKTGFPAKLPLKELTEQALLQYISLAGVLVNGHGDILYLHGRTGMYLEPAPGEAGINNILKMAREGLRRDLTSALQKVVAGQEIVRYTDLRVKTNGNFATVNLTLRPVKALSAEAPAVLYLVILEEAMNPASEEIHQSVTMPECEEDINAHITALKQELRDKEEYLQTAFEELETSNEELKSSNEEMQSVNEELQSTNEELETSKEELQSVNEELSTVNSELQTKVTDLSRANNDMNNLLAGTGIGTIFVDQQLRILRFTPAVTGIINLILTDVGRPVSHIVSNMSGYGNLITDIRSVLDNLIPKEIEVQTTNGEWYTMRILPYRTLDNVIEGAVITFVNITDMKKSQEKMRESENLRHLAIVVRDAYDAITLQDLKGNLLTWNPAAERLYGWSVEEAMSMNIHERIPESRQVEEMDVLKKLCRSEVLEPYQTQRIAKNGRIVDVWLTATALVNETGKMYAISTTERAI